MKERAKKTLKKVRKNVYKWSSRGEEQFSLG
jgi:hypothetical protein